MPHKPKQTNDLSLVDRIKSLMSINVDSIDHVLASVDYNQQGNTQTNTKLETTKNSINATTSTIDLGYNETDDDNVKDVMVSIYVRLKNFMVKLYKLRSG